MIAIPQTKLTSAGSSFASQNRKSGTFKGTIIDIREIKSHTTPTLFGVVEIQVPGESGVFQLYLNFNDSTPEKAQGSLDFIVAQAKNAILSSGATVDDGEKTLEWAVQSLEKLKESKAEVAFTQSERMNGQLDLRFIAQVQQNPVF